MAVVYYSMSQQINVLDLFCGAGGISQGFIQASDKYNIVAGVDNNQNAINTYEKNFDALVLNRDIDEFIQYEVDNKVDGNIDVVVGGPPCQAWSNAYESEGADDERGGLMFEYINIIQGIQPEVFVAENVPGLMYRHQESLERIVEQFEIIGYDVEYEVLDASYYNVPQSRKRLFIVGVKESNDVEFSYPEGNDTQMTQMESRLNGVTPTEVYQGSFSPQFYTRNRVRDWNEPAYTVMANPRYVKIHPQAPKMVKVGDDEWKFNEHFEDKYRRYSIEECAVLQSFPEEFEFVYDDIKEGYKLIGNAVPPNLVEYIASEIEQQVF